MDCADFLQMVSSGDAASLYDPSKSVAQRLDAAVPSASDLAKLFKESDLGKTIQERLDCPYDYVWKKDDKNLSSSESSQVSSLSSSKHIQQKFANNFFVSTWLIFKRFLVLWKRDKRVIIAGAAKNIIMGISVGGCYFSTTNEIQILGALFQAGLFIILGKSGARIFSFISRKIPLLNRICCLFRGYAKFVRVDSGSDNILQA